MRHGQAGKKLLLLLGIILVGLAIVYFSLFYPPVDKDDVSGSIANVEKAVRYTADIETEVDYDPGDYLVQSAEFQNLLKNPDFVNFLKSEDFSSFVLLFNTLHHVRNAYGLMAYSIFSDELNTGNLPSEENLALFNQEFSQIILSQEFTEIILNHEFNENIQNLLKNENFLQIIVPSMQDIQKFATRDDIEGFWFIADDLQQILLNSDFHQIILQHDLFQVYGMKDQELAGFAESLPFFNHELLIVVWSSDLQQFFLRPDLQSFILGEDFRAYLDAW